MGEIIKVLKSIFVNKNIRFTVDLEVNHPLKKNGKRLIHIQTEKGRLEFNEDTFVHLLGTILEADDTLKRIKGLPDDHG